MLQRCVEQLGDFFVFGETASARVPLGLDHERQPIRNVRMPGVRAAASRSNAPHVLLERRGRKAFDEGAAEVRALSFGEGEAEWRRGA